MIYLKRGAVFLLGVFIITAVVLAMKLVSDKFYVQEIVVSGNYRIDREDVIKSSRLRRGDPLLGLRFRDVDKNLRENAWIKKVSLRKQFPGTFFIALEEAVPTALLDIKKGLFIVDNEGKLLEKITGESTTFLPVIKGIEPENKKGLGEALKLVDALAAKNVFAGRDSVEIGLEPYGLAMHVEGEFIKVGYGNYPEKFKRWMELEPEIRKRGLELEYVDLRFKDSVIVKPAGEAAKESTS